MITKTGTLAVFAGTPISSITSNIVHMNVENTLYFPFLSTCPAGATLVPEKSTNSISRVNVKTVSTYSSTIPKKQTLFFCSDCFPIRVYQTESCVLVLVTLINDNVQLTIISYLMPCHILEIFMKSDWDKYDLFFIDTGLRMVKKSETL